MKAHVLLIGAMLCGGCSAKTAIEESSSPVWNNRSPCDQIGCYTNPATIEASCEQRYGATSGKPYGLFCDCAPNSNCSNSDCFSDCFRNGCLCGVLDGRPNACNNLIGPPPPPDPAWGTCTCGTGPFPLLHRFWCCTSASQGHTTDGWSCVDNYCGCGNNAIVNPCQAQGYDCCTSLPPRGCNFDGACEPDQGETCPSCPTDCCNWLNCSTCQQINQCGTACVPVPDGTSCTRSDGNAGMCRSGTCVATEN